MLYFLDQTNGNDANDGKASLYLAQYADRDDLVFISSKSSSYLNNGYDVADYFTAGDVLFVWLGTNYAYLRVRETATPLVDVVLSSFGIGTFSSCRGSNGPVKTLARLRSLYSFGDLLFERIFQGVYASVSPPVKISSKPNLEAICSVGNKFSDFKVLGTNPTSTEKLKMR